MKPKNVLLYVFFVLLLASVLFTGCVQSTREMARESEQGHLVAEPLVWPPSPLPPRIQYITSVSQPVDFGIKPGWFARITRFVGGADEPHFIKPTGVTSGQGIVYVADPGTQSLWILDQQISTFKQLFIAGNENLVSPVAVTTGKDGRLYLVDSYLAKVFVFNKQGELLSTIGEGSLQRPAGIAFDPSTDRLYVTDSAAHRIVVFSAEGQALHNIGQRGAGKGDFNFPTHITVGGEGNLLVTDSLGFRIQLFASDGKFLKTFGHHGNATGDFAAPKGVATDSEGHIYVVDSLFDTVQIFDNAGQLLLSFGERGVGPGQFWLPNGIFIDSKDRIYIADTYNQRIQIFDYLGRKKQ